MRRWKTWEGALRAVGEAPLGVHCGSHVWNIQAAKERQKQLNAHAHKTWIELFTDGAWKRITDIFHPPPPNQE
jgi:hypothetical protein